MHTPLRLLRFLLVLPLTAALLAAQARVSPKPLATPAPAYPAALTDSGRDGTATVEFTIDTDGTVKNPVVVSADDPAFGEAVLAALPNWKFQPGQRDGKPAAMKVKQPFNFVAPPEQRINAVFGRKVFIDLPEQPIAASAYRGSVAPLNTPPIRFPQALAGQGREATVEVEFVVTPQGLAVNPVVVGEAAPEFSAMAILHVAALVFEPAQQDGKPVYVTVRRSVPFKEPPPAPAP